MIISDNISKDFLEEILRNESEVKEVSSRNSSRFNGNDPRDSIGKVEDPIKSTWEVVEGLNNPAELITFFHPLLNTQRAVLHPWQVEVNEELAEAKPTSKDPYKFCLCAANGSGKDAFIIAPFCLWMCITKIRSLVVITTSSGTQMTTQTENYISALGKYINAFYKEVYGKEILRIRQRSIKCLLSGSEIVMFTTDEEGRAEGYHPIEPNAEMAIVVNEAKSVAPKIFRALRRCTGYNYWLNVSTPLQPSGDFYYSFENWKHKRRVTYFDCPHQSPVEFEADRIELGEHSPLFRSKWLALFTSVDGNTIISELTIQKSKLRLKNGSIRTCGSDWPLRFGIDLAAGGDENVISIWRGNTQLAQEAFREEDTTITRDKIVRIFERWQISKSHDYIFADDGGLGKPVIDMIRELGWNVRRIRNNSPPKTNKKDYRNRGAELWTKFGRMLELCLLKPLDDEKLWSQLSNRHYKEIKDSAVIKIQLESKQAEIAAGHKSPDRADAAILAFTDVTVIKLHDAMENFKSNNEHSQLGNSPEEILHQFENAVDSGLLNIEYMGHRRTKAVNSPIGSVSMLIKQQARNYYGHNVK